MQLDSRGCHRLVEDEVGLCRACRSCSYVVIFTPL